MNSIDKKIFPNGVTCLALTSNKKTPLNISVYFPGGRLFETEFNAGITYLMLKLMLNKSIAAFENTDTHLEIGIENHADFSGYSLNTRETEFVSSLRFLHHLVTNSVDAIVDLQQEKADSLNEIQKTSQDPLRRPVELFYQSLYAGHPYAFSRYGTVSTIGSITPEQINEWRDEVIQLNRMLIVVTGPLSSEKVVDEVFEIFGNMATKKKQPRATVLPMIPFKKFLPKIEEGGQERTSVVIGHKGVDVKDHRYYELEILRNWLAGGKGKLHQSFREKLSIAQSVNAYNVSLLRGGAFFLHAITKPEFEKQLVDYMTAFFSSLGKLIITKEAFDAAKQQAVDLFEHGLQDHDALSYHIASQYMAGQDPANYWDYETKIKKVQQSKMTPSIQEIFSEELYAVGIVRGQNG